MQVPKRGAAMLVDINLSFKEVLTFAEYDKHKTGSFPIGSGVYIFVDRKGKVLYVGESKALRKRLRNHLCGDGRSRYFFRQIEFIYIAELKAEKYMRQVVEGLLVNKFDPPYNVGDKKGDRYNGTY
jgi:excinuclease UvrABC nuclease subunit